MHDQIPVQRPNDDFVYATDRLVLGIQICKRKCRRKHKLNNRSVPHNMLVRKYEDLGKIGGWVNHLIEKAGAS